MKRFSILLNAVLICAMLFILASFGFPNLKVSAATPSPTPVVTEPVTPPACDTTRTVQVSGTAVVNVKPDRALIQLGVQSNGRSAKEAQAVNTSTINRITKALKALGIESKDIATDWYTIEPLYKDYDSLHIEGYRIYNIIAITMRDVGKTNDAIAASFQAGANQVVNVDFYTSELRKYRDQAREMAMNAASEKAEALANTAGADVGCILTINENTQSTFNNWWSRWYGWGQNQNLMTQNVVQNAAPASGGESSSVDDGPVSTGQISIRAEVTATFSLK